MRRLFGELEERGFKVYDYKKSRLGKVGGVLVKFGRYGGRDHDTTGGCAGRYLSKRRGTVCPDVGQVAVLI